VLRALKRDSDALASFEKALSLSPNEVEALGNRGDTLLTLGRPAEALECFEKILSIAPDRGQALALRGVALAALRRFEAALDDLDVALAAAPNDPMVLYNRAGALFALGRLDEALASYDHVVAIAPQHAAAWNNRGNVLVALRRHDQALESFAKALAAKPDYADAHFNRALAWLATGDLARGFQDYEWRWKRTGMERARRNYGRPLWLGEYPLANRTILVHAEQGLGDTIQFVRYIPLLARAGAKIVLEAPPELAALLAPIEGLAGVVTRGEPLPPFDVHCPLGSLPLAFKTDPTNIPAPIPYLFAGQDRTAKWRTRIEALEPPRIALAWSGNPAHVNDRNRSIPLAQLSPLWTTVGSRFVSIQREVRREDADVLRATPAIVHLGDELLDLADTAAVIELCDLVVSVDTAVAHLAAAMGRPVCIMLPFASDWRWTISGARSPWYPDARLFRQPRPGDWASVIDEVARELHPCVHEKLPSIQL
jgi:Tfp pilus assembly protein PilF